MQPHKTIVVIPTFNERSNIVPLVERIVGLNLCLDILIVDDNSPDGTGRVADELAARHAEVAVLHRPWKYGLGRAYATGFGFALDRGYEQILQMDADFSHAPEAIPAFLQALSHSDLVVGSRYLKGGETENWALHRLVLSRMATWFVRLITGDYCTDATSGFKGFRRQVLESLDLKGLESLGYVFQVEVNHQVRRKGYRVTEIPIRFADRVRGSSKLHVGVILEAIFLILRLRFKGLGRFHHANIKRWCYGSQRRQEYRRTAAGRS
ncbi:MAG: polyprenol monophosphomannose synthase [Deltaproteobacteria bacterium]|nr:polyprenol monophosphomannose synthase [Deltaproteobacteria bacterium]